MGRGGKGEAPSSDENRFRGAQNLLDSRAAHNTFLYASTLTSLATGLFVYIRFDTDWWKGPVVLFGCTILTILAILSDRDKHRAEIRVFKAFREHKDRAKVGRVWVRRVGAL